MKLETFLIARDLVCNIKKAKEILDEYHNLDITFYRTGTILNIPSELKSRINNLAKIEIESYLNEKLEEFKQLKDSEVSEESENKIIDDLGISLDEKMQEILDEVNRIAPIDIES